VPGKLVDSYLSSLLARYLELLYFCFVKHLPLENELLSYFSKKTSNHRITEETRFIAIMQVALKCNYNANILYFLLPSRYTKADLL
jgi:hypothetical protein